MAVDMSFFIYKSAMYGFFPCAKTRDNSWMRFENKYRTSVLE
jgi:hypothetical protein